MRTFKSDDSLIFLGYDSEMLQEPIKFKYATSSNLQCTVQICLDETYHKKFTIHSLPILSCITLPLWGEAEVCISSQSSLGNHPGTPCIIQSHMREKAYFSPCRETHILLNVSIIQAMQETKYLKML